MLTAVKVGVKDRVGRTRPPEEGGSCGQVRLRNRVQNCRPGQSRMPLAPHLAVQLTGAEQQEQQLERSQLGLSRGGLGRKWGQGLEIFNTTHTKEDET